MDRDSTDIEEFYKREAEYLRQHLNSFIKDITRATWGSREKIEGILKELFPDEGPVLITQAHSFGGKPSTLVFKAQIELKMSEADNGRNSPS